MVQDVFSLIRCSRFGLTEKELLDLLGKDGMPFSSADWSRFSVAINSMVINQSGLLNIFHTFLQKAIDKRYLNVQEEKILVHQKLANYWAGKEPSIRKRMEYPWHLIQSENYTRLSAELTNMDFFSDLYKNQKEDE